MDDAGSNEWSLVGERIRAARVKNGISVRELARRIDVSASHVSQVERGLASFSVRALYTVASVLGVSMDSLFEHPEDLVVPPLPPTPPTRSRQERGASLDDAGIVQRTGHRPTITLNSGPRWERLTAQPQSMCEFIEVIYAPASTGSEAPTDFARHEGREYGVVTHGSLDVQVGFESTVLEEGDSIALDSSVPHRFWNSTPEEVRAIWFVLDRPDDDEGSGPDTGTGTATGKRSGVGTSSHRGANAPHPETAGMGHHK